MLLLFAALPLMAQRTVSRIEVRGNVPAAIVLPQSALVEGRAYRDTDLEAAVARLRRLPFIFDARYSMEGETLVLEVTGETPLFFQVEGTGAKSHFDDNNTAELSGGARLYAGNGGVAEGRVIKVLAEGGDSRRAALGLSHYSIGGTRFFATAGIDTTITKAREFDPGTSWSLTVGYPLTVRQTLTASAFTSGLTTPPTTRCSPGAGRSSRSPLPTAAASRPSSRAQSLARRCRR